MPSSGYLGTFYVRLPRQHEVFIRSIAVSTAADDDSAHNEQRLTFSCKYNNHDLCHAICRDQCVSFTYIFAGS